MNKRIQPSTKVANFKCASCNTEFKLDTTSKVDNITLDTCSNCHPFYKNSTVDKVVKGRAEKFSSKFAAGLANNVKKSDIKEKAKKSNKKAVSIDEIK